MKTVSKWLVPEGGGAPLITMPNCPKPIHSCAPRTIMSKREWDATRYACYEEHDNICEICGRQCGTKRGELYLHQAHECYELDYEACTSTFKRLCCICSLCHNGIHSGRAITCYRNHVPLWTKEYTLEVARNVFELVHKWNKLHDDEPPLRVWRTFVDWLSEPSLHDELSQMIKEYDIHFYTAKNADGENGTWNKWKLIYNDMEYYSPYEDIQAWQAAMDKNNKQDLARNNLFTGDEFEELRRNIS